MRPSQLSFAVAASVVAVDLLAKELAAHLLRAGRVVHAGPGLELELFYNHAGAGNALAGRAFIVSGLAMLAVGALTWLALRVQSTGNALGFGLLLGGGLGNLSDRLFGAPGPLRGGVIDWLRLLGSRGSMNLADLAINLGLLALAMTAVQTWRAGRGTSSRTAPATGALGAGAGPV